MDLVYSCSSLKEPYILITSNEMFLPCWVPTFRGQKVVKHGGHRRSHSRMMVQLWQCFFSSSFFQIMRESGSKYHLKLVIIGPLSQRNLNGVSLAARWWPNIECWLGFQRFWTSIAMKPYIFTFFSGEGGSGPPVPPSGSAHILDWS